MPRMKAPLGSDAVLDVHKDSVAAWEAVGYTLEKPAAKKAAKKTAAKKSSKSK